MCIVQILAKLYEIICRRLRIYVIISIVIAFLWTFKITKYLKIHNPKKPIMPVMK